MSNEVKECRGVTQQDYKRAYEQSLQENDEVRKINETLRIEINDLERALIRQCLKPR